MAESHTVSFEEFDLIIDVTAEGRVEVKFHDCADGDLLVGMDFDTFREVIDAVGRFGMGMKEPYLVEYADTREAIQA